MGQWTLSLPILFRMYRNKKTAAKQGGGYRTRAELAVTLLRLVAGSVPDRRFHVVADSTYSGRSVVRELPEKFDFTGRAHFDAKLFEEPLAVRGRRKRGRRLPSPRGMLDEMKGEVRELDIYGRRESARIVHKRCLYYRTAATRPVSVVAVEPRTGGRKPQAFFTTDLEASIPDILMRYAARWSLEVAFHDSKQTLGFEDPQGWSSKAALRTAPTAMLLYSLVVAWFATQPGRRVLSPTRPWYRQRSRPSFADMVATLKHECLTEYLAGEPGSPRTLPKAVETLVLHCAGAA
jgi:hypothetical protein